MKPQVSSTLILARTPTPEEREILAGVMRIGLALSFLRSNMTLARSIDNESPGDHFTHSISTCLLFQGCAHYWEIYELLASIFPPNDHSLRPLLTDPLVIDIFEQRHKRNFSHSALKRMQKVRHQISSHLTDARFANVAINERLHDLMDTPILMSEDGLFERMSFPLSLHAAELHMFSEYDQMNDIATAMSEMTDAKMALFECLFSALEYLTDKLHSAGALKTV